MTKNSNKTFYIKVSTSVEKINSLKVKVTTKDAIKTTTVEKYKLEYECTSVGSGEHQNSSNEPVDVTAASTQSMVTYRQLKESSNSYKDTSKTVSFGTVEIDGRLLINKTDADTGKAMQGVGFTLQKTSGTHKGYYVSIDKNGNAVYNSKVTTLKTDKNGKIEIDLLEAGTYELIETVNPYYGYEDLPKVIDSKLTIKNGKKTTVNVKNQRKYIKISGYVWEDISWDIGKVLDSNNLYKAINDDKNDKLLENITEQIFEEEYE